MIRFKTILRAAKPLLGGVTVTVDRRRQQIVFSRNGETNILTVDELFDEIEQIFSSAKRAAPVTLDPFGGGTIERKEAPWLANFTQPTKTVL